MIFQRSVLKPCVAWRAAARHRGRRAIPLGITLMEVLVAIIVAMVGLFGVLALIPFAVRNAQIALDQESAMTAAQNAAADVQAYGLHNPGRWFAPDLPGPNLWENVVVLPLCMDPLGFDLDPDIRPVFPYAQVPPLVVIPRITLTDPSDVNSPMSRELASRLVRMIDDIVFDAPTETLDPPQMQYFYDSQGRPRGRQSLGQFSWKALLVPWDSVGRRYELYILVYSRRNLDRYDQVFTAASSTGGTAFGGGDFLLTLTSPADPSDGRPVRRGEYIVLMHNDPVSPPPSLATRLQVYRVGEVLPVEGQDNQIYVTLQGGDYTMPSSEPPAPTLYAVHVPDVVAVYQRTIHLEGVSDYWPWEGAATQWPAP